MKTFTIDAENQITVYASKKEAAAASATDAFAAQEEIAELTAEWPMQRLVGIWNSLPGVNQVSKFTSRKIAVERLWKVLQGLDVTPAAPNAEVSVPAPEPVAEPQEAIGVETVTVAEAPAIVEEQAEAAAEVSAQPVEQPAAEAIVAEADAQVSNASPVAETQEPPPAKKARKARQKPTAPKEDSGPREGSKTAQVVVMLQREGGATISEITQKMGWQKHTVRGFMAGAMKKAGYTVESFKPEGGERTYRINK
jgi:hypothetical protein